MSEVAVRIEPLTRADVAPAVELAVRVLQVQPGDRGEQLAADTGEQRRMLIAKANGQVVAMAGSSNWRPQLRAPGRRPATSYSLVPSAN